MPAAPTRRVATALALAALLGAGCSGDDDAGAEAPADETGDTTAAAEGDCAGTSLAFTIRATGETGTVDGAFAKPVIEDTLFNIYASDHGLEPEDVDSYRIEPPPGGHALLVAINAFGAGDGSRLEPLAVGEQIDWTATGDGTTKALLVTLATSEETYDRAESPEAGGTLTVTAVGDVICGELSYEDADKEVSGTFEAPVTG